MTENEQALLIAANRYLIERNEAWEELASAREQLEQALVVVRDLVYLGTHFGTQGLGEEYWSAKAAELVQNARDLVEFHHNQSE